MARQPARAAAFPPRRRGCRRHRAHSSAQGGALMLALLALLALAAPEDMGPHPVGTWAAGNVTAGNFSVAVKVYYPMDAGGPWKPIAVVHGGGANGDSYISLATILASH